jgi:hypothetical protein
MPVPKRDVAQMLEHCRNLILRRAVIDLPPKPTKVPGFTVEDVYTTHYKDDETAEMAATLIRMGLDSQTARAKEGARIVLRTSCGGFRFNSKLNHDFLPIRNYERPRRLSTDQLRMTVQSSSSAWNSQLELYFERLPRPLLFTLAPRYIDNANAQFVLHNHVQYLNTSAEAQHFIHQYYARQYLWLHSMRYYIEQLATLLSEAASWKAVYRQVPMLEHVWASVSGKHLSGKRRKGKPDPQYADLSEMLAGAMMVPDNDSWRDHCVI